MNRLLLAGALGLAACGAANATELPVARKALPVVYNWSGFYVGANAGISAGVVPLVQSTFDRFPGDPQSSMH
jgi:hypothetical protein